MDITWENSSAERVNSICPICGVSELHKRILWIPNPYVENNKLHFFKCQSCESLGVISNHLMEYTDSEGLNPVAWSHYAHVGAGIDFMVRPIERIIPRIERSTLLDVGCGYGFTLDYWRTMVGSVAVGVEPAEYGKLGRDLLGLDIHFVDLDHNESLKGQFFDIVYSSEVIEHVSNPKSFLTSLRSHLKRDGTLVITTPSAEFVKPESSYSVLLAVLSPGLHKLLFSASALEATLRQAGFRYIVVENQEERLVAFASDEPLQIREPSEIISNRYIDYLSRRAIAPGLHQDLRIGFSFRAFKELVNCGRIEEAYPFAKIFIKSVAVAFNFDPSDGEEVLGRVMSLDNISEYAKSIPFCLG